VNEDLQVTASPKQTPIVQRHDFEDTTNACVPATSEIRGRAREIRFGSRTARSGPIQTNHPAEAKCNSVLKTLSYLHGKCEIKSNQLMLPVNASGCSNPTRPPVQQASVIFPLGILPSYSLCPSDSSKSCYMPIQQGLESTTGREPAQQISVMPPDSSTPVSSLHSSPCMLHDGVLTACSQSSASYSQPLLPHYPLRGGSSSNFSTPSGTGTIALFVQICIVLALFHHVWSIPSKHPPLTATKFPPPCISRVPHTLQK